jgi:hypothetical protein
MIQFRGAAFGWLLSAGLLIGAVTAADANAAGEGKAVAKPAGRVAGQPPTVKAPIHIVPEGLHFGMAPQELLDFYDKVFDQDFVPIYKATPVGPKIKEVDAALAEQKSAFARSEVAFGNLPTGIDNTPLKGEYNYKNNETMMSVTRLGVARHFFFQGKRLWKIYDDMPLKKEGELGASYQEAVAALTKRFGVAGRVLPEDAAHGRMATEVDWTDGTTHVRAIDRTYENLVGLVFEERSTAERLAVFRASQKSDEGQIDPTVAAVTRGGPAVDPNASAADAYTGKTHGSPGSAPPPPKKK